MSISFVGRCLAGSVLLLNLFISGAFAQGTLISRGSVWKYLDNGSDQGTAWKESGFDDSSWASGPARLGYGGDGEVTTVSYGSSANNKYITTYFRRTFDVQNPKGYASLVLNLLRDDGAVVYLNGTEVRRDNMPEGSVNYRTTAVTAIGDTDEQTYFSSAVSGSLLVVGQNVLAVEIHQSGGNSSDISFDLELRANTPPGIALTAPSNNMVFNVGQSIPLSAIATDSDGSIAKVQFFQGSVLLGEAVSAPYSYTWTGASDGQYAITAVVTDNDGASTTSAPVTISVIDPNPPALVSAIGSANSVMVNFSKRLDEPSATNIANYQIDHNIQITGARFGSSPSVVILTTSAMDLGTLYQLTVNNVADANGKSVPANSKVNFVFTPFTVADLGNPAAPSSLFFQDGAYQISGGGTDIGGTSDQCAFAYQNAAGDFDFAARLVSLSPTDPWAKGGLMMRETLDPNSRSVSVLATPGLGGLFFESRTTTAGQATTSGNGPLNYPDTWIRLRRSGNSFSGYWSFDGKIWTQLGSATLNVPSTVFVGLAVASHNAAQSAVLQAADFGAASGTVGTQPARPWEPLGPSSRKTGLVISEIMYKPAPRADGKQLEFVEIYNSTPFPDNISGYRIAGDIDFTFPQGTILPPSGFLVIARVPSDVQSVYHLSNVMGPYTGSLKTSGTVRLRSNNGAIFLEVPYSNDPPWPVAADETGHSLVLARPSYGEGFPKAWDISDVIGGSPGTGEAYHPSPLRSVVINEILAHTDDPVPDYIELYNHSNGSVDISGCILTDSPLTNRFIIPAGTTLPSRGFVAFDQNQLGFALSASGETIYLKDPGQTRVLDAVKFEAQENGVAYGRSPDGADSFYRLASRTPGAPNSAIAINDVAINEIMYAPISEDDNDQYIELHNHGSGPVDLSGWRFTSGIDFTFPAGTALAPDAYLVVAKNAAHLMSNYPNLNLSNTLGNFDGKFSGKGERVALAMPDTIVTTNKSGVISTNTIYIAVDEVTYGQGGRWGNWAHGGGSSLELIDSHSDHRQASNWADSDETGKGTWTTIEATGLLDNGQGAIDNLQVVMLGEAECLLDNVEFTVGAGGNLISNPDFESGLTGWTPQGNHIRSTLETSSGFNSSQSLHIRSSSRGDTGANRLWAQLTSNPTSGQTATIRAKARWLTGWPQLVLRTKGNWMEAAGTLPVPANLGTPGARNSRAIANAGPAIHEVTHTPPVPAANEPVVVTARAVDPDGLSALTLHYRIDPSSADTALPMTDDGTGGDVIAGDGIYSATIPGQASGALAAFYIQATDGRNGTTLFPNNAPQRECLVRFGDPVINTSFGVYRQWFTQKTIDTWMNRPVLSNERLDGTFIYGNFRVIYNFGSRFAGSPYHQGFGSPLSDGHYSIEFPLDDLLLGTENFNKVHAPGNGPFDDNTIQREQTSFWLVRNLGLPWLNRRYVVMYINGNRRGTLMEDTQVPGSEMVDEYFPDDTNGDLYKIQPWFEFDNSNSRSMGFNNDSWCTLNRYTTTGGVKKLARYRWNYLKRAVNGSANDYSNVFALIDAANSPDTTGQAAAMNEVADMEQWMRTFAVEHAVGNWDSFGAQNAQNMYGYKPENGKWNLFIWDYNIVLGNSGSWSPGQNLFTVNSADNTMPRVIANPPFRRAYWRAMKELCTGPMLAANANPIVDGKYAVFQTEGINVASPAPIKSFIASAQSSILSQLAAVDAPAFVVNGPAVIDTASSPVTLTGSAPVEVKTITVNGTSYPVTWTSVKDWTLQVPVNAAQTTLRLQSYNLKGEELTSMSQTITVNYSGQITPVQGTVYINEWMASNTKTITDISGKFDDWLELFNPTDKAVSLDGYYLSNDPTNKFVFQIPNGYSIPSKGYLLVWADSEPEQNQTSSPDLHANFKLSKSGETVALFTHDGALVDSVVFGEQISDVSEGRIPDGSVTIQSMTHPTPLAQNEASPLPSAPEVSVTSFQNNQITLSWSTVVSQSYRIEFSPDLSNGSWIQVGDTVVSSGNNSSISLPVANTSRGFYRIVVAQ